MKQELLLLEEQAKGCTKCELHQDRTKSVFARGNPEAKLMIVGEGPGQNEDEQGLPFVGKSGQLLDNILEACGWNRDTDIYICNVVKCRPPGNRTPLKAEIESCSEYLDGQINLIKPKFILCLGSTAALRLTGKSIGEARVGWNEYKGIKVLATYHPSYLLRPPNQKEKKLAVWNDLEPLREAMKKA